MNNTRNQPGTNAQYLLFNQVNGICPLCAEPLLYCKDSSSQHKKNYELAHIYPLNPTAEEVELLKDEPKLSQDVNSLDNFIPLCPKCHNRFDNPRTVSEYRILYSLKQRLIAEERSKNMFYQYTIAEEIQKIVLALTQSDLSNSLEPLDLTALRIEQKLEKDFSPIPFCKIERQSEKIRCALINQGFSWETALKALKILTFLCLFSSPEGRSIRRCTQYH